jgi:hypothetical protein
MGSLTSVPVSEDEATIPDDGEVDSDVLRDISRKRNALAACPEGHTDRGQLAAELGEVLYTGYEQSGDIALIREGVKVEREALSLRPRGHPDRALSCSDLAAFLLEDYRQAKDVAFLDEAIELGREALAFATIGPSLESGQLQQSCRLT